MRLFTHRENQYRNLGDNDCTICHSSEDRDWLFHLKHNAGLYVYFRILASSTCIFSHWLVQYSKWNSTTLFRVEFGIRNPLKSHLYIEFPHVLECPVGIIRTNWLLTSMSLFRQRTTDEDNYEITRRTSPLVKHRQNTTESQSKKIKGKNTS